MTFFRTVFQLYEILTKRAGKVRFFDIFRLNQDFDSAEVEGDEMKPQKPYLDRFKVPHFGTLNNGNWTYCHSVSSTSNIDTHIHAILIEESADSERNESVLQSLVLPDLRHIGIKTSLSHSEDNEEHYTYDSKKGLRNAISQAYRR